MNIVFHIKDVFVVVFWPDRKRLGEISFISFYFVSRSFYTLGKAVGYAIIKGLTVGE